MDLQAIEADIKQGMSRAEVELTADENKLSLRVVSEEFAGLSKVKRQQKIYGLLNVRIKSGEIHALSMETLTPTEAGQ